MKLLICLKCGDIFNLTMQNKTCSCGESSGKYVNNLNVEIKGKCKAMGFENSKFQVAYQIQKMEDEAQVEVKKPVCCYGVEFTTFFIPELAMSVRRVDK